MGPLQPLTPAHLNGEPVVVPPIAQGIILLTDNKQLAKAVTEDSQIHDVEPIQQKDVGLHTRGEEERGYYEPLLSHPLDQAPILLEL